MIPIYRPYLFLEDFLMAKKPTYEELERRVKELEKVADELRRRSKVFLASDQEKEAILNSLMEHVIHQDTEMRILWANCAACESANLSYEEIIGRYCYRIWAKRSDPCPDCPVVRAMETGQPQAIEKYTPDGRYWFIRGYPFRDKNGDALCPICNRKVIFTNHEDSDIHEEKRRLENQNDVLQDKINTSSIFKNVKRIAINKLNQFTSLLENEKDPEICEKYVKLLNYLVIIINEVDKFLKK